MLMERDRRDPAFAGPDPTGDPTLSERTAWMVWAVARLARMGFPVNPGRWRYHFRIRCGFTDASDECFDRIWNAESLTWPELSDMVARCSSNR